MSQTPLFASSLGKMDFLIFDGPFRFRVEGMKGLIAEGGPGLKIEKNGETKVLQGNDWELAGLLKIGTGEKGELAEVTLKAQGLELSLIFSIGESNALLVRPTLKILEDGIRLHQFYPFVCEPVAQSWPVSEDALVYDTGYQSWSFSGLKKLQSPGFKPGMRLAHFSSYNLGARYTGKIGEHSLHWAGAWGGPGEEPWCLLGAASAKQSVSMVMVQAQATGVSAQVEMDLDGICLEAGQRIALDGLVLGIDTTLNSLLKSYGQIVAGEMGARVSGTIPSGVCTWYEYFTSVRETDFREAIVEMAARKESAPVDCLLLDDGWQKDIGDWTETNKKFRPDLSALTAEARQDGFESGLWFAPFYVRPTSAIFKNNPQWLLRDENQKLVKAGVNPGWGGNVFSLDPSHPEVQEHLKKVSAQFTRDWGFSLLKLDFCFSGFLPGVRHQPNQTRLASARAALTGIREAVGESVFLLGCGMPILPAVGIFDGMRLGPDTAPYWEIPLINWVANGAEPAAKGALATPLNRQWQHGKWWWNDPDCLVLRRHGTTLSKRKRKTIARVITVTGGMRLMGDAPAKLEEEGWEWLKRTLGPWPWVAEVPDFGDQAQAQHLLAHLPGDPLQRRLLLAYNLDSVSRVIPCPSFFKHSPLPWIALDMDKNESCLLDAQMPLADLRSGDQKLWLLMSPPTQPSVMAGTWHDGGGLDLIEQVQVLGFKDSDPQGALTIKLKKLPVTEGSLHLYLPPGVTFHNPPPTLVRAGMTHALLIDGQTPLTITLELHRNQ